MDSLLKREWLQGCESTVVLDEASVAVIREHVRERCSSLPSAIAGALVNIASELGFNQLRHARRGEIALVPIVRGGVAGFEIIAVDEGAGIADPTAAVSPRPKTEGSLGVGIASVLELADEVDFDVRIGEGTCVRARKFASPVSRARQVGVFGRPCPGEIVSGDHAMFVRGEEMISVALADGLGHGLPAREASDVAIDAFRSQGTLLELLERAHRDLAPTRGVVAAVARVNDACHIACAGNIGVHLYLRARSIHATGPSFVLGSPGAMRRPMLEEHAFERNDMLVMFTDGVSSRADIEQDLDLRLRAHPIVVAHQLVQRFARDNDDALVVVVR